MADIYVLSREDFLNPDCYEKVDGSPCSLLLSDKHLAIEGIKFLRKGTSEWQEEMISFRRVLEKGYPEDIVKDCMEEYSGRDHVHQPPFFAVHDKYKHKKRLIGDNYLRILGEVCPAAKRIDFFHARCPDDMVKNARYSNPFHYDGTLDEALKGFEQNGFTFNLFDTGWHFAHIENEERTKNIPERPVERVSLDEVVRFGKPEKR